jgi:formate dehydrogenase maturation protein FdhE
MVGTITIGIKAVTEKYCPIVGHNVVVEVTQCGFKETGAECLQGQCCKLERGGCTNSFLNAK